MKAYFESFSGERFIGEIVHDDEYTPRGTLSDINPECAYKVIDKQPLTQSWDSDPISGIRARESVGYVVDDNYMCWEITEDEMDKIMTNEADKEAETEKEICNIERTINAIDPETLPTREETRAKERQWNDTYNEGGEGYVPHTMDKTDYDNLVYEFRRLKERMAKK